MTISFKNWLLQEIAMGSDGTRDNQSTQTAQATAKVAQNWLANKKNSDQQTTIATGQKNPSTLAKNLINAGTQAVDTSPKNLSSQTTAPKVASFLQNQFKLPQVIKPAVA